MKPVTICSVRAAAELLDTHAALHGIRERLTMACERRAVGDEPEVRVFFKVERPGTVAMIGLEGDGLIVGPKEALDIVNRRITAVEHHLFVRFGIHPDPPEPTVAPEKPCTQRVPEEAS